MFCNIRHEAGEESIISVSFVLQELQTTFKRVHWKFRPAMVEIIAPEEMEHLIVFHRFGPLHGSPHPLTSFAVSDESFSQRHSIPGPFLHLHRFGLFRSSLLFLNVTLRLLDPRLVCFPLAMIPQ